MHRLHRSVSFVCLLSWCHMLHTVAGYTDIKGNVSVPLSDPLQPGCSLILSWIQRSVTIDFSTQQNECQRAFPGSDIVHVRWIDKVLPILKKIKGPTEMDFFLQLGDKAGELYCVHANVGLQTHAVRLKWLSNFDSFRCNRNEGVLIPYVVCTQKWCPPPVTTTTSTTAAPVTTKDLKTDQNPIYKVKVGALGISVDNELLLYRVLIVVLVLFILIFITLLVRTCARLRRANMKHSMTDARSHVSIRRVTEAVVDPYSSMAGIVETSSLGGQEFYGSIARRKELNRERKAWLRDHGCDGSHIGIPYERRPSEDMNGLLPPHGSVHQTSMNSLTQGGGHNGSLSRIPIRAPQSTFPVRPTPCQLSRQNTGDSLQYRNLTGPHLGMAPSPGTNGGLTGSINQEEMEGHMV